MTAVSEIPLAVKSILDAHPGFPSGLSVLIRKDKDIESDIAAALNKIGGCLYILPVLPRRVSVGYDEIFVEDGEIRVRLLVMPTTNKTGMDVYELMAQTMLALHGKNPGSLLVEPMTLRKDNPVEFIEDPEAAVFDILYTSTFDLKP